MCRGELGDYKIRGGMGLRDVWGGIREGMGLGDVWVGLDVRN